MHKYFKFFPSVLFFGFILGIIYDADLDRDNVLIRLVHGIPFGDKICHFLLYGVMALLLNYALGFKNVVLMGRTFLLGSVIILTFAIAEEFTQLAFESRTFDLLDMAGDIAGVYLISALFLRKRSLRKSKN